MRRFFKIIGNVALLAFVAACALASFAVMAPTQAEQTLGFVRSTGGLKALAPSLDALEHLSTTLSSERISTELSASPLTDAGIIALTNAERAKDGARALAENAKLDQSALAKAQDMLAKQYFEHVSPTGKGPSDLADEAGYSYFVVGENLAEGDFASDADLIAAWMASPGHRANILNKDYRDIGIAAVKGVYQGQPVWMAVQEFGVPTSVCAASPSSLQPQIDADKAQLAVIQSQLDQKQAALDAYQPKGDAAYRSIVADYNALINQYNAFAASSRALVNQYNAGATAFNACAAQFKNESLPAE